MHIEYDDKTVETLFMDLDKMKKMVGIEMARTLKKRLDQLKASKDFGIFLTTGLGRPHPLTGNLKGCYGMTITGNVRLVIKPNSDGLDPVSLKRCDTIVIKGVMDDHGKKTHWLVP